jgi:hypothetical protein
LINNHSQKRINALSYSTIRDAVSGDATAINKVVDHYTSYISKLSTKQRTDQFGNTYKCVDTEIHRQLQTKLITKILKFKLQ